jgi:hypothetical protein
MVGIGTRSATWVVADILGDEAFWRENRELVE